MNTLDIIIIIIVLLFMIKGYQAGLVRQVINLLGFLIAIFLAYKFSKDLAPYLEDIIPLPSFETSSLHIFSQYFNLQDMFYNAIAFLIIFIGVKILLSIALVVLDSVANLPGLAIINRSSGALIGLIEATIIIIILVNFIKIMPWANLQSYLETSSIATRILELTPMITEKIFILWDSTEI